MCLRNWRPGHHAHRSGRHGRANQRYRGETNFRDGLGPGWRQEVGRFSPAGPNQEVHSQLCALVCCVLLTRRWWRTLVRAVSSAHVLVRSQRFVLQRFLVARVRRDWLHSFVCTSHTELGVHRAWLAVVSAITTVRDQRWVCCARVGLDCGYFARKMSSHKWCFALAVPHKGVENLLRSRACATMLSRAGCARVVLRGDTEPAMVALRTAFGRHLARQFGTDGVPQDSSLGFLCR